MAGMRVPVRCALVLSIIQLVLLDPADNQLILDRCTFAREMYALNVPRQDLSRWVWLAERLSNFRTSSVSPPDVNSDGYRYYGLFKFSGKYWCKPRNHHGADTSHNKCNVICEELLSHNIEVAVRCAEHAKKLDGWGPWKTHLYDFGTSNETSVEDCFDDWLEDVELIDGSSIGIAATWEYTSKDIM